jgi:hypothetical protein
MNFIAHLWNNKKDDKYFDYVKANKLVHTPDIAQLELLNKTWLFNYVPGLLDQIPGEDKDIKNVIAFTEDKNLFMWKKNLGDLSFPVPMNYKDTVQPNSYIRKIKLGKDNLMYPPGKIRGQLILLRYPGRHFISLDKDHANTVVFARIRTRIMIPFHRSTYDNSTSISGSTNTYLEPEMAYVRAWMYVGIPSFWSEQILQSNYKELYVSPMDRYTNKRIGDYYMFRVIDRYSDNINIKDNNKISSDSNLHTDTVQIRKRLIKLNEERNSWNVKGYRK